MYVELTAKTFANSLHAQMYGLETKERNTLLDQ